MIKALLFDLGGVIIRKKNIGDDFPTIIAENIGADPKKLKSAYAEYKHLYRCGKMSQTKFWSLVSEKIDQPINPDEAMQLYITMREEVPGMISLIADLTQKYTLVLANNQAEAFDTIRDDTYKIFQYFDYCCSSWITGYEKPEQSFFEKILKQTGYKAEECLFIDDNPKFIAGAKKIGITGIIFENSKQLQKDLQIHDIKTNL